MGGGGGEGERGRERGVFSLFAFSPKFHLCLPPFPQMHLLLRLADRSPLWVLLRDRELQLSLRASSPLARSRVLARLASLAQIGELARRLITTLVSNKNDQF